MEAESAVAGLVKVPLTDNQFFGPGELCVQRGRGAFAKSTLLKKLNEGVLHPGAGLSQVLDFRQWQGAAGAGQAPRRRGCALEHEIGEVWL